MKSSGLKSESMHSSSEIKGSPDVNLISLTYSNKLEKIVNFLDNNLDFDLLPIKDVRLYTLLHIACLNNQINIARCLFHHLKYNKAAEDDIKTWVNAKTDEGFTALHFASFKGNIELVRLLESNGADITAKNNQGLTVIHIAAQGDQPVSIAYFHSKGLSLNQLDNKGSTPLHWAAFLGMENATTYLTSWGCSPNSQDNESGLTPLHLAVISGNPRVVRRLLVKGADKTIQNKEGKLPIDLAMENEYDNIVHLLRNKNWLLTALNIKPSLQKKRTRFSLGMFIVLYLAIVGLNLFFIFPFIKSIIWVIVFGVFASLTLIFFFLSWLSDPGYMKNANKGDILNLLLNNDPHLVCPECVIVKPLRSKHCEYCNACISVYDHHCPWINNCVGARNHAYFIIFTISSLLAILVTTVLGVYFLRDSKAVYKYFPASLTLGEDQLQLARQITCAADIVAAVIFVFPLFALNVVQASNIFGGKTTSERFGFNVTRDNLNQTLNQSLSSEALDTKYSKMKEPNGRVTQCFTNCITMCCLNRRDNRYKFTNKMSPQETSQNMSSSDLTP